jgi:HK97 family phage portal protein
MAEGGIPHAVLKSQRKLTKEQAEKLQNQWVERTAVRRGAPAVLPPEVDFEAHAFSPKDLLLLDAQEFEARVIASAFGVPPFLLNLPLTGGLTYQSPEMLVEQWWRVELRPAALRISQALSANMLPRGSWVEFESRDVLAPPLLDLVKAYDMMLKEGVVTVDEYRAAVLRLPPQQTAEGELDKLVPAVAGATGNVQPLRPALPKDAVVRP